MSRSAYPVDVDALIPAAQKLAEQIGEIPSRRRLMKEYRIGAPKARTILDALRTVDGSTVSDPAAPTPAAEPEPIAPADAAEVPALPVVAVDPDTNLTTAESMDVRRPVVWPVLLLCLPAFVAIWSGWVELGGLAGFGIVHPLPGIADDFTLNTAITLPIGVETYAAYALWVWLSGRAPTTARRFAKWSAIGSLIFGGAGQVAYHLLNAAGLTSAPWPITAAVACLPVAVLGMGAALAHLQHADQH